ncbi:MAG: SPFH domain-containing protein [Bacteroidetes bacterium]|nr:SPFH domain-containing protein [Bacteroidota bacterium]
MSSIIDFVKWDTRPEEQLFAWKFPETNLSTYTQLIVSESQEAILFSKGQVVGKFGPGKHTLNTENLPILRNLFGIPFGGKNPFTAEVWFVNKLMPLNLD